MVFALVEKQPGFLTTPDIDGVMNRSDPHVDDFRHFTPDNDHLFFKSFQSPHFLIIAGQYASRANDVRHVPGQVFKSPIHGLRQGLNHCDSGVSVAVYIYDETRQAITFRIDRPPRRAVDRERAPERNRVFDTRPKQHVLIRDVVCSEKPQRDLRLAAPERDTERPASF